MTPTIGSLRSILRWLDAEYAVAFTRLRELGPDARDDVTDAERGRMVQRVMLIAAVQVDAESLIKTGHAGEAYRHIMAEIGG